MHDFCEILRVDRVDKLGDFIIKTLQSPGRATSAYRRRDPCGRNMRLSRFPVFSVCGREKNCKKGMEQERKTHPHTAPVV